MSAWREFMSWNKFTQIASRAVRTALVESERVAAEKRATVGVKYQTWANGVPTESAFVIPPKADK